MQKIGRNDERSIHESIIPEVDTQKLRGVFGRYATGIAVVTTVLDSGEHLGVTVNSFTSVSLEPPLVLFCILNRASHYAHWERSEAFTINILAETQRELSNMFARPSSSIWEGVDYVQGHKGVPVLRGNLATIECVPDSVLPAGDHLIVIGRVVRFQTENESAPLLYYRGAYAQLDLGSQSAR